MGICKPGYTSIHSIVSNLPDNCKIDHSFSGEHQFWTFYFTLKPSFERQIDEVALGRINNVVSVVRLTREMYNPCGAEIDCRTWWLCARQEDHVSLPRDHDTIALIAKIETQTGRSRKYIQYLCFLPIVTNYIVGTLRGHNDLILARFEHESFEWGSGILLVSMGSKPIELLKATVAYQQRMTPRPPSPYPPGYPDLSSELYLGKLTYCTWNSLQPPTPTTATSAFKALKSFPLMPNNLLIDDGWQCQTDRQMTSRDANLYWLDGHKSLKEVIIQVKNLGVEKVGVWHTVLGYWGGVARSQTFRHHRFATLRKRWGDKYSIIHPDEVDSFFETWYKHLSASGVDFVKCDDMAEIEDMDSCVDDNGDIVSLRLVRTAYVYAIKRNIAKYFSGRIIWCMAHSPRHLLGPNALSNSNEIKPYRSSNDYFPMNPGSHAYHVYTNVVSSQFLSCITIPDFDMFQTHPFTEGDNSVSLQGPYHASLRALGHGPITVTDVPERCVSDVFMRLAGRGRDGKTIALNADRPLEILDERCFDDVARSGDGKGLRGYAKSKWGVSMGIWNVRDNHGWVKDALSMDDAFTVSGNTKVICWSYARQDVFILKSDPAEEVLLKELEFDIFSMVEMNDHPICLGLVDKYNTFAAIESCEGNIWRFRCLGSAVWAIPGHHRVIVKVEGETISSVRWALDDVTLVRAGLCDYKDTQKSVEQFWKVEVVLMPL